MLLIDRVVKDLDAVATRKQIRPFDLRHLGYLLSPRKIAVGVSPTSPRASFYIYEVLDGDTKKAVTFSYLYCKSKQLGIVLNNTFDHYILIRHDEKEKGQAESKPARDNDK